MENRLKEIINNSGYKQTFLASQLGVHKTEISQWIAERRRPSHNRLKKLSKLLKCRMSDLIPNLKFSRKVVYKGD